jgi:hypothetical protein
MVLLPPWDDRDVDALIDGTRRRKSAQDIYRPQLKEKMPR